MTMKRLLCSDPLYVMKLSGNMNSTANWPKRVLADLEQPNWDDIQAFMDHELFDTRFTQGLVQPAQLGQPYYGVSSTADTSTTYRLALLPTDYAADFAHDMLYRLDALEELIEAKIQHPYHENGEVLTPDQQLDLRHFSQKLMI